MNRVTWQQDWLLKLCDVGTTTCDHSNRELYPHHQRRGARASRARNKWTPRKDGKKCSPQSPRCYQLCSVSSWEGRPLLEAGEVSEALLTRVITTVSVHWFSPLLCPLLFSQEAHSPTFQGITAPGGGFSGTARWRELHEDDNRAEKGKQFIRLPHKKPRLRSREVGHKHSFTQFC